MTLAQPSKYPLRPLARICDILSKNYTFQVFKINFSLTRHINGICIICFLLADYNNGILVREVAGPCVDFRPGEDDLQAYDLIRKFRLDSLDLNYPGVTRVRGSNRVQVAYRLDRSSNLVLPTRYVNRRHTGLQLRNYENEEPLSSLIMVVLEPSNRVKMRGRELVIRHRKVKLSTCERFCKLFTFYWVTEHYIY